MKKTKTFQVGETVKVFLMAIGFIGFVMLLSYLYWFA